MGAAIMKQDVPSYAMKETHLGKRYIHTHTLPEHSP